MSAPYYAQVLFIYLFQVFYHHHHQVFVSSYDVVADAEKLKKDIGSCYKKCQKYSQGQLG